MADIIIKNVLLLSISVALAIVNNKSTDEINPSPPARPIPVR
jgi:hypothetical protein